MTHVKCLCCVSVPLDCTLTVLSKVYQMNIFQAVAAEEDFVVRKSFC